MLRRQLLRSVKNLPLLPCARTSFVPTVTRTPLNFDDAAQALSAKTTPELVRAKLVLDICSIPFFVNHGRKLLKLSEDILGPGITHWLLRKTFFGHFCAGEDASEVQQTVNRLSSSGIGAILDYAAEKDSPKANIPSEGVISARIFDYDSESACDSNLRVIESCIRATASAPNGFAALKMTALGDVAVLEHVTNTLHRTRRLFRKIGSPDGISPHRIRHNQPRIHSPQYYLDRTLNWDDFKKGMEMLSIRGYHEQDFKELFNTIAQGDGEVSYLDWIEYLQPQNLATRPFFVAGSTDNSQYSLEPLSADMQTKLDNMVRRVEKLVQLAAEKKVRLMIDAEQTYFQPAIDHITLLMQRKYNKTFPTVYATYQAYLTDSWSRVKIDLEQARRHNYIFACKLVRGAYMVAERKRASELGYSDPIWPTIEDTHANYHRILEEILNRIDRSEVMVASHNEESIKFSIERMAELAIDPAAGGVYFGQLLGMCDHVSFALGMGGYKVYKYVPYGPIDEVLPYLLRRAEENSSVLGGVAKERNLIAAEIKRRMLVA